MTSYTKAKVPMAVGTLLGPSLDKLVIDIKTYRSMIGLILYLIASRPDIMFSMCNWLVVSSKSKRTSFYCREKYHFPSTWHKDCRTVVSFEYIIVYSSFLRSWSMGLSIRSKEHHQRMSIPRWETCESVVEKADMCNNFNGWGWIHCCCNMYISSDLDPKPTTWLWD